MSEEPPYLDVYESGPRRVRLTRDPIVPHRAPGGQGRSPDAGDASVFSPIGTAIVALAVVGSKNFVEPLLGDVEERNWLGLHHHALLTMLAVTFPQHHRCARPVGEKPAGVGPPSSTKSVARSSPPSAYSFVCAPPPRRAGPISPATLKESGGVVRRAMSRLPEDEVEQPTIHLPPR